MAENKQHVSRKPILLLFVFLAIWAVLIAVGIMRQPEADARKAIFIVATVVAFVAIWVVALFTGTKRSTQNAE
jgi:hypothetical protein